MAFELQVLKAHHGDCLLISGEFDGQHRNILIDGGPAKTFALSNHQQQPLQKLLLAIKNKNQKIDLLILTHVDDDHIGGLLAAFKKKGFLDELTEEVWFNSGKLIFNEFNQQYDETNQVKLKPSPGNLTSIAQGVTFEKTIEDLGIWKKQLIRAGDVRNVFGTKFTILSPNNEKLKKLLITWKKKKPSSLTASDDDDYHYSIEQLLNDDKFKEDGSPHNGSSIAFIFEFAGKSLLFLGDAHPSPVIAQLKTLKYSEQNPLQLDYMKVSHHGSKANTNNELLKLINCNNFIISTNGLKHKLPHKLTLARIIKRFPHANLMFNYPNLIGKVFPDDDLSNATFTPTSCDEVIKL